MGGPPSPALLRIRQFRRNFVKDPSMSRKTGLLQRVLSTADQVFCLPCLPRFRRQESPVRHGGCADSVPVRCSDS